MVIQFALLDAVHAHPVVVVTVVLSGPPAAVAVCDVEESVKLHVPVVPL
jgi:hypothetical protein